MGALQIRRGLKANLPSTAALGEPLIATDSRELYVGTGTSIYKIGDIVFADVEPAVEKEKIWVDTVNSILYRAAVDGLSWVAIGSSSGGDVSENFTVYGVSQGTYVDGNIITAGTPLETVIKNMLQTIIPPTYTAPTLSLSGSGPLTVEAGTAITPTLTPTFTQRDGGAAILYTLKKNGLDMFTNATAIPQADSQYTLGDASVSYQANETYAQGPIKKDNQGNDYPTGRIPAGTATSGTVTYAGKRNLFYVTDTSDVAPVDSAGVRAIATRILNPANGTTFTLNIPAGAKRIVFAYPATLRDVNSAKYVELGNGEVKDTFTQTLVNVEGAAGFTAVSYKLYTYVPAVPFGSAATYNVTI